MTTTIAIDRIDFCLPRYEIASGTVSLTERRAFQASLVRFHLTTRTWALEDGPSR